MAPTPAAPVTISEGSPGQFWDAPEQYLLDAGNEGELVIARIRVGLILVLLLIPLANLLWAPRDTRPQHLVGLALTLAALLPSAGIYVLLKRGQRKRWLSMATSLFDVTLVTIAQIIFAFVDDPQVVVNSKITFDVYFIALAGTCLRYDRRVALVAGLVCIAQFVGTILFVRTYFPVDSVAGLTFYGRFAWADQISRVILLTAFTVLCVHIVRRLQQQRRLSSADPLTGVFNRRFFDDYLHNELARMSRYGSSLAVAMIDVDHFKQFNDHYGHAAGDRALQHVAHALDASVRRSDLVARYGGEEFVVIFRESSARLAMERLEYIRELIGSTPLFPHGGDNKTTIEHVTVSVGVATWPTDGDTEAQLLAEADRRLFMAKRAGRNRVVGPSLPVEEEAARV